MGSVSNNNWYNLNSTRKYPLDDGCTGITDRGEVLPNTLITDINITLPRSLGVGGMISSVKSSATLLSVTFLAVDHPIRNSLYDPASSLAASSFKPLCAITLAKPVDINVPYPLTAFADGVVGWIVFGEGIRRNFDAKFSNPIQSGLNPKNCHYYDDFPVTSIGKAGSSVELQGLVRLEAGNDVSIVKDTVLIDGEEKTVISFSLKERTGSNVLDAYKGPCGGRPESKTCSQEAIEFINTVRPDCNGNIDIMFESPLRVSGYPSKIGGLAVDYPIGLIDACTAKDNLPDSKGVLPTEYQNDDQCNSSSLPDPDANAGGTSLPEFPPVESISSATLDLVALPACMPFDSGSAGHWQVVKGGFNYVEETSPVQNCGAPVESAYGSNNLSDNNVSIWYNGDYESTVDIRVITDLKLMHTDSYSNGGIVLNYRTNADKTFNEYFVVEINTQQSALNIRRFNGSIFITLASVVGLGVLTDVWYRLIVTTGPGATAGKVSITATLYSIPGLSVVSTVTVESTAYLPDNGKVGVCSNRANAVFSYFYMENI